MSGNVYRKIGCQSLFEPISELVCQCHEQVGCLGLCRMNSLLFSQSKLERCER